MTGTNAQILAMYKVERQKESNAILAERKARKAREYAEKEKRFAEEAARRARWGHYGSGGTSLAPSDSNRPTARQSYIKALQDWTYGRSQWKPVTY